MIARIVRVLVSIALLAAAPVAGQSISSHSVDVATITQKATAAAIAAVQGQIPAAPDLSTYVTRTDISGLASTSSLNMAISSEVVARNSAIGTAVAPLATTSSVSSAMAAEVTARNTAITSALNGVAKSVNGAAPDAAGNVVVATTNFITGFTPAAPGSWASLLSGSPCNAARVASYAVVYDLYSGAANTNEVIRCGLTGAIYAWKPQRENFAATLTTAGGSATFTCGVNAPITFIAGTFTSSFTVNLNTAGCWPGAQFQIANNAVLGVNSLTFTGILGGLTKTIGLTGRQAFYYDATNNAWQAF